MANTPGPDTHIIVKGARVHNLKNISVEIPRDKLVVITGPSGSGKSSLAFDTIYAEGQRRYVESLSTYARQFLEQAEKPEVESVTGLSPTISIVQKTTSYNPRSTVGTVTELYDYLRVLFAKVGKPVCWKCREPIRSQSHQQIVDQILDLAPQTKIALLAPVARGRKGEHQRELVQLRQMGFVRARINGTMVDLSEDFSVDSKKKNDIDVYVDRVVIPAEKTQALARVSEGVEMALRLGKGEMILQNIETNSEQLFSEKFACTHCGISYPEPEPRTFSFNSPMGACPDCDGLGFEPAPETEVAEDAADTKLLGADIDIPDQEIPCESCEGARLRRESLHFFVAERNISSVCALPISDLLPYFDAISLTDRERRIVDRLLREIRSRLKILNDLGVGYLTLARTAQTLSGGEAQRIRLATQIGSHLVGVTYVLDEPSIGLHPRDNDRLLDSLRRLRDLGNTVLVVEHDRDTMETADWILDIGPGAGKNGGEVVAQGDWESILKSRASETAAYLSGKKTISIPSSRRKAERGRALEVRGAEQNNLKNLDVSFPLGTLTCVTGISGSGKSTLVIDTLYRLLLKSVYKVDTGPIRVKSVQGLDLVDKVVDINQRPIGRTPRSNPATYIGLFSGIRDLFAGLPESQIRGYKPGRFSFNVKGGRCESCEGDGLKRVEMHFLPDVFVVCDSCAGKRFNRETLSITYKNKSIAEVLDLSFEEAATFFENIPQLQSRLQIMNEVGLGYLHLGQAATTLSGGEAQRVKLARELARRGTGKTVYILDEPTTGLHFEDIRKLIAILQSLVNQGNTVIVIEHNLDVIKVADYLIDMGPEGGAAGGEIVAQGTPEEVAKISGSFTGKFLKKELDRK